jgi:hypothetical protein
MTSSHQDADPCQWNSCLESDSPPGRSVDVEEVVPGTDSLRAGALLRMVLPCDDEAKKSHCVSLST